jgi:transcriptional regulator with XRE-family HTH domain
MNELLHTEFRALLRRGHITQARFSRLTGYSVQQINAWCQGRAAIPRWAVTLALMLQQIPIWDVERLTAGFEWHETLGVDPADPQDKVRKAMAALTNLHHPDRGGNKELMKRVAAAYEVSKRRR